MKYMTWECKIVVPAGSKLPDDFDGPPRRAAMDAVSQTGIPVLACFSGWGGELTPAEEQSIDQGIAAQRGEKDPREYPNCSTWCPDCGWRLKALEEQSRHLCQGCGLMWSALDLALRIQPEIKHGYPCEACKGTGEKEVEFTQQHPYGMGSATEYLVDIHDCEECGGIGHFEDDNSCIVCGQPVIDGVLIPKEHYKWEVHEACWGNEP